MSKKKYKLNLKKFIPFLLIVAVVVAAIVLISGRDKKPNPKRCKHNFENGICTICGGFAKDYCKHQFEGGVCTVCGMQCDHKYENGICKICGMEEDPKLNWPNTTTSEDAYPLSMVTDDLLVLVNKTYHVTESYAPKDLTVVKRFVQGVGDPAQSTNAMRKVAAEALNEMLDVAASEGYDMKLRTGYRSYTYQQGLFNSYARNYGESEANKYSARAGHSEHQTGLAVDIDNAKLSYTSFGKSKEFEWMKENAYKYGFILRYTKENEWITGYKDEPWHYRYVGTDISTYIHNNPMTFEEYYVRFLDK